MRVWSSIVSLVLLFSGLLFRTVFLTLLSGGRCFRDGLLFYRVSGACFGCVYIVDYCDVHPCFGLKDLGVEEAQNWMINLVKRGTSQTDQEGLENPVCTP